MTLIGENEETEKIVLRMLTELLSMLEDSREDIGHFWRLDRRRGEETVRNSYQQTWWTMGENYWGYDAQLCRKRTSYVLCYQRIRKRRVEKQRKRSRIIHFNGSDDSIELILRTIISVNQLSVHGAAADLCGDQSETHEVRRNPPRMGIWNQWLYRQNFLLLTLFFRLMPKYKETCCVNTSRNRRTSWTREIDQTLLQCWFLEEYLEMTILHHTWWWYTSQFERIMSRVDFTWKWGIISRGWVGPWKHEDRPCLGCEGRLSSRTLRCGDHDRIFISWQSCFLGWYREWNQQIRNRNVRRDSCCKCWGQRYRETCREGKTTTDTDFDVVTWSIIYRERKWIDVEPGKFTQGCFEVSKFMIRLLRHDDTVHREDDGAVRFDDLAELLSQGLRVLRTGQFSILAKGGGQKKRFQYCLNPNSSKHFLYFPSNPGTFRRYSRWSYIARQCTVAGWLRRVHLPHRECSRHAFHHPVWIDSRRKKSQNGQAVSVFHSREPDVRQSRSGRSSIRSEQPPELRCTKYLESSPKYSILVQSEARSKKRVTVLSNTITRNRSLPHYLRFVLRKRYAWRLRRCYTMKYTNLHGCLEFSEAEFAKWRTRPTWSTSKKILRPPKRIGQKLRWNL